MNFHIKNIKKFFGLKAVMAIAIILILSSGGYWWYTVRSAKEMEYLTQKAVRSDLRSIISATGELNPEETVDVGTQISGTINEVYIDYNSVVKKGDLIAEMDSATQKANVESAKAELNSVRANLSNAMSVLVNAQKNYSRTKILASKDLVAKSDLDDDEKVLLVAKAEVASYSAKVAQYKANLAKAEITLVILKYTPRLTELLFPKMLKKDKLLRQVMKRQALQK